jgi:hypothetical protein
MSPIFDASKWSLNFTAIFVLIGGVISITATGTIGVVTIHSRLTAIEQRIESLAQTHITEPRFAKWITRTEKLNVAAGAWTGADMDLIP